MTPLRPDVISFLVEQCAVDGSGEGWSTVVSTDRARCTAVALRDKSSSSCAELFRLCIPAERAFDLFYDPSKRLLWDRSTTCFEVVQSLTEHDDVILQRVRMPNPLSPRESLNNRYALRGAAGGHHTIAWRSCVHRAHPKRTKPIRIWSMGAYVFKPSSPTACELSFTVLSDPGGSIPKWIVNAFASRMILASFRRVEVAYTKTLAGKREEDTGNRALDEE